MGAPWPDDAISHVFSMLHAVLVLRVLYSLRATMRRSVAPWPDDAISHVFSMFHAVLVLRVLYRWRATMRRSVAPWPDDAIASVFIAVQNSSRVLLKVSH